MHNLIVNNVRVDAITKEDLEASIIQSVVKRRKDVYAYVNVHAINLAQHDTAFRKFLNDASVVYCDGEGVRLGGLILGSKLPPRIALTYFVWDLCASCEKQGMSVFFLGASVETVNRAVDIVKRKYPRLGVQGWHHGYFNKEGTESDQVIKLINGVKPNILFVGFGMPVQEHWIAQNLARLETNVILPCGSMIDYAAGQKNLSPVWMSDHGLEWLHRLVEEPTRLWRRYLLGNPLFLGRVLRQRFLQGKS